MPRTVTVRIWRSGPSGQTGRWQTYSLPLRQERATVLDLLFTLQAEQDPTIAFRCACRVGMCGTCGMRINGREGLACRTYVHTVGESITLEPMAHLPVVRDLVVDMAPFFERYRRILPYLVPAPDQIAPVVMRQDDPRREAIDAHRECIACGLCLSACRMVGMAPDFLGPAALNRAYVLVADPRDTQRPQRLTRIAHEGGLWRCHTMLDCTAVCPKGLAPTDAIQRLRRKVVAYRLKSLLTLGRG
ncbi:MAG: succinate dehydrogenase/fumarate reductase iron-sulfur subunit [Dehalococcoidia bacterium]|nr:succinate dehydrogenase/fumarate reductase iron-sulfur subunit [Dehalococcoidia bacterium]MDW8120312.1 succinate dehydrogenase/fumarate reductase iron-sulfur subunit [Chloroflexota bacterium]